ncbi:sigma-70 family RNA polymerase sigma factor [Wenzhouxiangella sp. AB-CW3]|uniref:ECF-type sigma factor n=1 Tax=Wenzhouxiangella sp. AB-CW3 TaxID=2771012 RepID=UPI00168AD6F0|nr:ECF-type sigma factor [Wenzhouxiangella sp. AB-CW3]QOC21625.1 sigma-70 family RNA polymerase sigma factor [Wenzhouxiangella sp. AB-CW3]
MPATSEAISDGEVTRLLSELREQPDTIDRILPLIYDDLREVARCQQARFGSSPTLQTTELVHEAFLKLRASSSQDIRNRLHLKRLTSLAIRQLIVDHARGKLAAKRGSGNAPVSLNEEIATDDPGRESTVLEVDEALSRLEAVNPRLAEVVIARFFGGMTADEIAEMLDISQRTVQRDWDRARAWLLVEMQAQ